MLLFRVDHVYKSSTTFFPLTTMQHLMKLHSNNSRKTSTNIPKMVMLCCKRLIFHWFVFYIQTSIRTTSSKCCGHWLSRCLSSSGWSARSRLGAWRSTLAGNALVEPFLGTLKDIYCFQKVLLIFECKHLPFNFIFALEYTLIMLCLYNVNWHV